jgi:hypothetical protein
MMIVVRKELTLIFLGYLLLMVSSFGKPNYPFCNPFFHKRENGWIILHIGIRTTAQKPEHSTKCAVGITYFTVVSRFLLL